MDFINKDNKRKPKNIDMKEKIKQLQHYNPLLISHQLMKEKDFKGFSPQKLITLLGNRHCSLDQISECFRHTLRVVKRKVYGRYDSTQIKHLSVCERGDKKGAKPHIHTLIEFDTEMMPIDEWVMLFREVWINTDIGIGLSLAKDKNLRNESWCKDVYDLNGVVNYLFKNSRGNGDKYLFVGRNY